MPVHPWQWDRKVAVTFAPDVARRYRDTVLAAGGSRDAADLVEEFLGRPYDNRAFTAWLES